MTDTKEHTLDYALLRQVVEPVRVGHELVVGEILGDLFLAAVEVAEMGDGIKDEFAIRSQDDAQDAVGGGVVGATMASF